MCVCLRVCEFEASGSFGLRKRGASFFMLKVAFKHNRSINNWQTTTAATITTAAATTFTTMPI